MRQRLTFEVEPELPNVMCDPIQLARAVGIVAENALTYSGSEPVLIRTRRIEDEVAIEVIDQGPGIPQSERAMVFEPFTRGTASRGTQGTGLGLSIVRQILALNESRIEIDEASGGGALVRITVPMAHEVNTYE